MEQYQLSNQPSRYQLAQHFQSSLDEPNLDNVEAKLYAIRQRNYQMAQQFFEQKYGSSAAFQQYLQQSNMPDLIPPKTPYEEYNDEFDMKSHLQRKALQIQREEMQQIQQQREGKVINRRPNSSKKNPWLQQSNTKTQSRQQSVRTSQQYHEDEQVRHYIDQSLVQVIDLKRSKEQQKKGQFMSEFKQYLANKKRMQSTSQQAQGQISPMKGNHNITRSININNNSLLAQSQNINQSMYRTSKSNHKNNSLNKFNLNKSNLNKSALSASSSPQEELVKKIFKNIYSKRHSSLGKSLEKSQGNLKLAATDNDYVEKIQLAEYMTQNQRILDVLGISSSEIVERLQTQLQTKDPNKVKFHQCLMFVYQLLGKEEEQKKLFAKHCFSDIPQGCMLQEPIIRQFEKVFKQLDKNCDLIVKRLEFVERLALDPMLAKVINTPAVFEPHLNKTVSLRRVFERIEVQTLLCEEQDLKAKEYISWAEFIRYFESGHTDRGQYDILRLVDSLKQQEKMGFADIPETVYEVICEVIKKLDKKQEYFSTQDLVGQILLNKVFQVEKYTFVRGKGNDPKSGNIPMETFQQTLMRIKETGPKYITVKEFLQFFSVKGRPVEIIEQQLQNKIKAQNQPAKVATVQQQIFGNEAHQIQGYDSDPEFYNNSQLVDKRQFQKSLLQAKKNMAMLKYSQKEADTQSNDIKMSNLKVTVPKPFKFEERQKQRAQERQMKKLNRSASVHNYRSESEFKFRAKEIPEKVKQKNLYSQMIEENIRKTEDRKKCSMLLTLANEQPFSFYNRKAQKKTKEQREEFKFKANPIPWFCSVNLLKKQDQKQIYRNEKIARMAQESLSKAKLPPRMQKDFQEKLARKNLQANKKQQRPQSAIKAKQPPNFEVLHKQFESALERKRKENKTTEIKQFNFSQVKREKKPKTLELQQENLEQIKEGKEEKWRQTLKSSINVFASSTAKFDQQVEKRRKQMEEKKRKESEKQKEEEQRNKVNQELNKKLKQQMELKKENAKQSELIEKRRSELKAQEEAFKNRKAEWLANAAKQPLLVERPLQRDLKIEKMIKLHQISQNLKKNGIKGKEHDQYFKKDELLLLQDYAYYQAQQQGKNKK